MFAEPKFVTLPGGGVLAYDEYGSAAGTPVLYFHGWPASRLQGAGCDPAAADLGARIIAPDRPGIGLSTHQPGRRLLDWPPLVAALAQELGLKKFRILAVSGGGPYALVTAWALPEMVEAVAVVSGAPPLPADTAPEDLFLVYRILLGLKRRSPAATRWFFRLARPFATIRPPHWLVGGALRVSAPSDYGALADAEVWRGSYECYLESWRGSGLGVAVDGEVYSEPWGFDPGEIRVPVSIWHGRDDRSFGWKLAERLAARIPGCRFHVVENEGHFSLPIRHTRAVIQDLLAAGA